MERCSKEEETCLIGLVGLVYLAIEYTRTDVKVDGLKSSRDYLHKLSSSKVAAQYALEVKLTKYFVEMATSGHGINLVLKMVQNEDEQSCRIEPYLMLLSHYKKKDPAALVRLAD